MNTNGRISPTEREDGECCNECGEEYSDCGCLICGECLFCDCMCYEEDENQELIDNL